MSTPLTNIFPSAQENIFLRPKRCRLRHLKPFTPNSITPTSTGASTASTTSPSTHASASITFLAQTPSGEPGASSSTPNVKRSLFPEPQLPALPMPGWMGAPYTGYLTEPIASHVSAYGTMSPFGLTTVPLNRPIGFVSDTRSLPPLGPTPIVQAPYGYSPIASPSQRGAIPRQDMLTFTRTVAMTSSSSSTIVDGDKTGLRITATTTDAADEKKGRTSATRNPNPADELISAILRGTAIKFPHLPTLDHPATPVQAALHINSLVKYIKRNIEFGGPYSSLSLAMKTGLLIKALRFSWGSHTVDHELPRRCTAAKSG